MTPTQVGLVQQSYALLQPIKQTAATMFYERLFRLDPSFRTMFTDDMMRQRAVLLAVLSVAVDGLNRLDRIVPMVEALGRQHMSHGVQDEDYATVGSALLWTLEETLGAAFTPEVRDAWAACYNLLAGVMRRAARKQAA
jgi:hemoglobin-like flavoprotein